MRRESYVDPDVAALIERVIEPATFEQRVASLSEQQIVENVELIAWFMRHYPSPRERLLYATRKYAQWTRPPRSAAR